MPPMYSALKVDGQKLVNLARKGKTVERKPRDIEIYSIDAEGEGKEYKLKVHCSKGTYMRTLCEDIGEKLGCPVVETTSTTGDGLKELVTAAIARQNAEQTAPYHQGVIDLTDKKAVEAADRQRFTFVNDLVTQVEKRKIHTRDKNYQDSIDAVLTNPIGGGSSILNTIRGFPSNIFLLRHKRRNP